MASNFKINTKRIDWGPKFNGMSGVKHWLRKPYLWPFAAGAVISTTLFYFVPVSDEDRANSLYCNRAAIKQKELDTLGHYKH